MAQVSSPLPFTREAIDKLNGSVTFEEALALFNVNSPRFKSWLRLFYIYAWKEPNGSLVWVDGEDYDITIYLKGMRKRFVVKFTDSFEDVIHMLEKQLNLSPGCYKLTCKHFNRTVGKVLVKTARDWDYAVLYSKTRGYIVPLHLEVFASSQTADEGVCFQDVWHVGGCDDDLTDDGFDIGDLDEDDYDYDTFYLHDNEDVFDEVSGNSMKHITKQRVLSLNNGSVTFEQARASFNVDLSTFKARLEQLNIFVWKEVDGSLVRIHGGDYQLTIFLKSRMYVVKGTTAFENVSRMLERDLGLSPGCYNLTFKHPNKSIGNVWLKSDREWHFAVSLSKLRGYFLNLYLKPYGEDAHDKRRIKKRKRA